MRKERKLTDVGIYHIILRGNSRFVIFYDDEDREQFCSRIAFYSKRFNAKIYVYALMDNHIHILAKADMLSEFISATMVSFVKWYNHKHKCSGNLCSSPFKSVPKNYFDKMRECVLYILSNPVEAGIVQDALDYKWSSACLYYGDEKFKECTIPIETSLVKALMGSENSFTELLKTTKIKERDIQGENESRQQIPYSELCESLNILLNGRTLNEVPLKELKFIARSLTFSTRATYIQIANILHVGYEFVRNTRRRLPQG